MTRRPVLKLSKAEIVSAARKAYDEGRLSAQGPTPECSYRDWSGRPCAIGAAIPDDVYEQIGHILEGRSADNILPSQGVHITAPVTARALQVAHDSWVNGYGGENAYRKLIGLPPLTEGDRP